jgi:hypothetical protein
MFLLSFRILFSVPFPYFREYILITRVPFAFFKDMLVTLMGIFLWVKSSKQWLKPFELSIDDFSLQLESSIHPSLQISSQSLLDIFHTF